MIRFLVPHTVMHALASCLSSSYIVQMRGLDCRQMHTPLASACVAAAELQWTPRFPTLFMAESAATIELSASDVAQIHVESDAMFDAIDTNTDGVISVVELRTHLSSIGYAEEAADKLFELIDANENGECSREELRNAYVEYSQDPSLQVLLSTRVDVSRIHAEADAFFDAVDTNGDGAVSPQEMRKHVSSIGYEPAAAERFFALLDADKSGEVSRDEVREAFLRYADPALRLALGLGTSEADSIFVAIDANGDGDVEQSELALYLSRKGYAAEAAATIFATLDVNGDGRISREELRNGYVRYAALRDALGMTTTAGSRGGMKQPLRWGRGARKGPQGVMGRNDAGAGKSAGAGKEGRKS